MLRHAGAPACLCGGAGLACHHLAEKTETYEILGHPKGGRKDVFCWAARDGKQREKPMAELEIYRPGGEFSQSGPAAAEIGARMHPRASARHVLIRAPAKVLVLM
jgi:hypothetical protein